MDSERLEKLIMELRRGALVLAVLLALDNEHYGYSLRKLMKDAGMDIEEGTLYPLLRRLEEYGLLSSEWREEAGRKRRFYRISKDGREIRSALLEEWQSLEAGLNQLQETTL
jgi:DNA-binding PadR family transcriptional regulator